MLLVVAIRIVFHTFCTLDGGNKRSVSKNYLLSNTRTQGKLQTKSHSQTIIDSASFSVNCRLASFSIIVDTFSFSDNCRYSLILRLLYTQSHSQIVLDCHTDSHLLVFPKCNNYQKPCLYCFAHKKLCIFANTEKAS